MEQKKKNQVYLVSFLLILLLSFIYKVFLSGNLDGVLAPVKVNPSETLFEEGEVNETTLESTKEIIDIYICGAVNKSGVYKLTKGSILNDGITLAGGFTEKADKSKINLVYVIEENISVYIPEEGEELAISSHGIYMGVSETTSLTSDNKININTASLDELSNLPGIGPSMAQKIIMYREKKPFATIEEIKNVSGIGDAKYDAICDLICV